jgi:uncharacterized protein (TIRG00374 family)
MPAMSLRAIQIIAGLACTSLFLALALYRVQLGSVGAALANANPTWIGAAVFAYWVNLMLRIWRWQIILSSVAPVRYSIVARALLVGYGLNTIMPARLGELFRAEFAKRIFGLSRVWTLTSIVIERLFDGLTVVFCLGIGLFLSTRTSQTTGILTNVLLAGGFLFGMILLAAFCLSGSVTSRILARLSILSTKMERVQSGFEILRTWRIMKVAAATLIIYLPDALSLWFCVKAVGLELGFADTLVLVGAASLSTLVPSGPAFLGTLQYAYAVAIEFAGGPRAAGIAAATLAQLCLLSPVVVVATGIITHRSGNVLLRSIQKLNRDNVSAGS